MYNEEDLEAEEDQIINEEYKIWKKNTPFLYDLVISNALEWPSLTVNWLPSLDIPEKSGSVVQKMLLGTHTSGNEPNHLMIMKVRLPNSESTTSDVKDTHTNLNNPAYAHYNKIENKLEVETRITHQGEVNKARVMPQKDKFHIIATLTPSGEVHIFDYFKHPPKPNDSIARPDMRLVGHTKEGYGLNWSTRTEGYLLTGADDHRICVWDIKSNSSNLTPLRTIDEHKGVVEDVNWHKHHESMFATVGDDKKLIFWDLKQEKPISINEGHTQEINSVEFNPMNEFLLLTASNDKTVALWDIRNLSMKIHNFDHHRSDVVAARWNPNVETLFASFSSDRRVNVWDMSKIGAQQSVADLEDGPAELLFTHGGHTAKISDFDWNPKQELMCASVAEDNIIHIWEMANSIYYNDEEHEDDDKMRVDK